MSLKKGLRLAGLILLIALACIMPFPITTYRKDNLPKHRIEQVEQKEEDNEENDAKFML